MGIPEKEVVFCYVGKIIPEKGVDLLIKSGIEAMKAGRDLSVLCAGGRDEEYFGRITELIESSGFKRRFHFLRPVPNKELFNLYSIADVGVWPKQCSLTMIEAMACHLPVIISDGSGATERVTQMTSGLIYHEDDIADLRAKMEEFFDGETLFAFGQNARRYAECHDWTKISTLFESLYRM